MGVLFGLGAALAWGVSDYATAKLTKQIGVLRALAWTQIISCLLIGVVMLIARPHWPAGVIWLVLIGMGTAHLIGTLLLYRAFAIGTLAVVGPVSAAYTVVQTGLTLLTGKKLGFSIIVGTLLVLGGIALVTQKRGDKSMSGVPEALLGAAFYGLVFWSLDQVSPHSGYLWPLLMLRVFAVGGSYILLAASASGARLRGEKPPALNAFGEPPWQPRTLIEGTPRVRQARPWIIAVALLDTAAWACMSGGFSSSSHSDGATITTTLSSLSHAVTVGLAWALLHDKLSKLQWVGVAVVLLGVFLLSL